MKIRVPLEALVGEKFHHLLKGEFSLDIFRRASSLNGVVSSLGDRVQKPVNPLFFGGRVAGVVVGKLSDQFFVEVNVGMWVVMFVPWTCRRFSIVVRSVLPRCFENPW